MEDYATSTAAKVSKQSTLTSTVSFEENRRTAARALLHGREGEGG